MILGQGLLLSYSQHIGVKEELEVNIRDVYE